MRGASLPATAEPADSAEAAACPSVRLLNLSLLRRQFNVLARQRPSMPEGARVGAWADFTTMAAAVIGEARIAPLTERYLRGQTALYGETSDYVRKVIDRLQRTQP